MASALAVSIASKSWRLNSSCAHRFANARPGCRQRICLRTARMLSQSSTAQSPSFSRTWSEPVPKLSSPQRVPGRHPAGCQRISTPSAFQRSGTPMACATRSAAAEVGIDRAIPFEARRVAGGQMRIGGQHRQDCRRARHRCRAPPPCCGRRRHPRPRRNRGRRRPSSRPSIHAPMWGSDRGACRRNQARGCR